MDLNEEEVVVRGGEGAAPEGELCARCDLHAAHLRYAKGGILDVVHGNWEWFCRCCALWLDLQAAQQQALRIPKIQYDLQLACDKTGGVPAEARPMGWAKIVPRGRKGVITAWALTLDDLILKKAEGSLIRMRKPRSHTSQASSSES